MAFVKGQSGNPAGRPKELRGIRQMCRDEGPASILTLIKWRDSADAKASVTASLALLDRGYGKPVARVDHRIIRSPADLSDEELSAILASGEETETAGELVH